MKKKNQKITLTMILSVCAALVLGCGGSPTTPTPSSSQPTKPPTAPPKQTVVATTEETTVAPSETVTTEAPTPEDPTAGIDTSVTFEELYREMKRNKLNFEDTYNGKRYLITAEVNGMSTSGLMNLTGGATLTMVIRVDNTIVSFLAEFERDQEEKLKTISVGDTITFTGTCYDCVFSDCDLLIEKSQE